LFTDYDVPVKNTTATVIIPENVSNISDLKYDLYVNDTRKYLVLNKPENYISLLDLVNKLYEKGYSGLDLIQYIEESSLEDEKKYQLLLNFNKFKKEFRNEKLFMTFIFNFYYFRSDFNLENISFM
jgi:hypothetical protein